MDLKTVFKFLKEDIHTAVFSTLDENGLPESRVIDVMLYDGGGIYFITAKGKRFYDSLVKNKYAAVSGFKERDTMSSVAVSLRGKVEELGDGLVGRVFEENPYMNEIYPSPKSRSALTVFKLYSGEGEYFDLSKKPIERFSFTFGGGNANEHGYFVGDGCILCGKCIEVCPQSCIELKDKKAEIKQENCLSCGNCMSVCPAGAVERR